MKTHNKPVIMIDFGGVYFSEGGKIGLEKIAKKFKLSHEAVHSALRGDHRKKYSEGKITSDEYWKTVSKKINLSRKQLKEAEHIWHSSYTPRKDMMRLVRKLRHKYRVSVLSANYAERVKYLDKKYNVLKEFHHHHFSFNHGITKPDVKLFLRAANKLNVQPKDCIVVDDNKDFLKAVKKTGGKAVLFKDAKHLEKELGKLGVKI
ncbi:MAG: HAD-IA family hydrolase [Candidatus Aenigmarchaeota archaeon]|nr:HAD-IA family hydrolase [Candidatus Aenigmarchaeota archaeon]